MRSETRWLPRLVFATALAIACSRAVEQCGVRPAQAEPAGYSSNSTEPGSASAFPSGASPRSSNGDAVLEGPVLNKAPQAPAIALPQPGQADDPLPINLATALHLSNARPLVIAFAETAVQQADAELLGAKSLWLPTVNFGMDYYAHDGADQATDGTVLFNSKNSYAAGAGTTLVVGITDAIFRPLAARQQLAARQWDVQSARNDALLAVAVGYFDVQEARGRLAGNADSVAKAQDLERRIASLSTDLVAPIEVDRARTVLAELKQRLAASRGAWRVSSARLTRQLRLNPGSVVVPLEPPHLQVTLVSPRQTVDDLIPIGLLTRPELAAQRALVEATLVRLRQEKLRPLLPSAVLTGGSGPLNAFNGAIFGGGRNDGIETSGGRFDAEVGLVWSLANLGVGNRALVRERAAEQQLATIQFFRTQDQVAAEVVEAQAQLEAATTQVVEAATGVKEAAVTFQGNLVGISQTTGRGDMLQLVNRPQEAVAALQELNRAYDNYYAAVNSYNRAQFQLYHALGCPSRILASDRPAGEIQPVDTRRPPQMAPVCPHVVSSPDR
jgi:outer membrane protein TolC